VSMVMRLKVQQCPMPYRHDRQLRFHARCVVRPFCFVCC